VNGKDAIVPNRRKQRNTDGAIESPDGRQSAQKVKQVQQSFLLHHETRSKICTETGSTGSLTLQSGQSSGTEDHDCRGFQPLAYERVVKDYYYRFQTFLPVHFGSSLTEAKKAIQETLDQYEKKGEGLSSFLMDEEYKDEIRSQKLSIRMLNQLADQERLENIKFEEEARLRQRELDYYGSKSEYGGQTEEFHRLCNAPVYFVTNKKWEAAKKEKCRFGKECKLCKNINHQKIDSLNSIVPSPHVQPSTILDSWDHLDEVEEDKTNRKRRSSRKGGQLMKALFFLSEMLHTLNYIEEESYRLKAF
jgi:hypothetical protein